MSAQHHASFMNPGNVPMDVAARRFDRLLVDIVSEPDDGVSRFDDYISTSCDYENYQSSISSTISQEANRRFPTSCHSRHYAQSTRSKDSAFQEADFRQGYNVVHQQRRRGQSNHQELSLQQEKTATAAHVSWDPSVGGFLDPIEWSLSAAHIQPTVLPQQNVGLKIETREYKVGKKMGI